MSIHNYQNPSANKSWADLTGIGSLAVEDLNVENFVVGAIGSGAWTPTFSGFAGVANVVLREARWFKINNLVTARVKVDIDTLGTAASFNIDNLPEPKTGNFTPTDGVQGSGVVGNGGDPLPMVIDAGLAPQTILVGFTATVPAVGTVANFDFHYTTD